jgi:anti-sigma factor RsiW
MKTTHLTDWEQEEYLLGERTPQMLRHLAECGDCRGTVERMQHGVALFRSAAVEWSTESLATRPQQLQIIPDRRLPVLRWALAAAIPLVILLLALLPLRLSSPRAVHPAAAAAISDDALLDQVDEQLSVAVPSSMESLTHLVSADDNKTAGGSKPIARTN